MQEDPVAVRLLRNQKAAALMLAALDELCVERFDEEGDDEVDQVDNDAAG